MTGKTVSVLLKDVRLVLRDGHGAQTEVAVEDNTEIRSSAESGVWKIVGPSGSGKTTILKLLGLMDRAADGARIEWSLPGEEPKIFRAEDMLADPRRRYLLRQHFGFSFQHAPMQPQLTVLDNLKVRQQLSGRRVGLPELETEAAKLFQGEDVNALLQRYPFHALSMGQKQRFSLLLALAHGPSVLFADEPTANLDAKSTKDIETYINAWAKEGEGKRLVLWVTHGEGKPATPYIDVEGRLARIIR
jgi:ABC-type lipoprotein export system ATPase subunit